VHVKAQPGLALVLWQDCQIDKFKNQKKDPSKWFTAVAPIRPITEIQDGLEAVREGKRRAFFHLPAWDELGIPEGFVDLRYVWPVSQSILSSRVATLSTTARLALYDRLFAFLTRE